MDRERLFSLVILAYAILAFLPCKVRSQESRLDGYVEAGYKYRSDGDETDQDATQLLSLDYFLPWTRFNDDGEVGFSFYGALQEDLDGESDDSDVFTEVADAYGDSFAGWVYVAYGEYSTPGMFTTLRLGRQDSYRLEPVSFDGGFVKIKPRKGVYLAAFGGVPVNLYEDYEDRAGDSVAGVYAEIFTLKHFSLLAGYMNLRDKLEMLDGTEDTLEEDLLIGEVAWRMTRTAAFTARVTGMDDEVRDASIRGLYFDYDRDFRVSAYYYRQFMTREAEPIATDPFSLVLADYEPYHQGSLTVYKGLSNYLGVEGGATFRELMDYDDETIYNHTYERYMASLYIYKAPFRESQWIFGADLWSAPGDAYQQSYRGEYSQKIGKRGRFQAGTAYSLYKIDEITGTEDEDVQYYYIGLTAPVMKQATLRLDYSFEDGSLREVDTFRARFRYEF